jgi:hypothetical protein
VLVVLSYSCLPLLSLPFVGTVTALTLAGDPSIFGVSVSIGPLHLLRVVPFAAAGTIALGLYSWRGDTNAIGAKVAPVVTLVCSALIMVAYLIPYSKFSDTLSESGASDWGISASTFLGGGFWLALIGAAIAAIGAGIRIAQSNAAR